MTPAETVAELDAARERFRKLAQDREGTGPDAATIRFPDNGTPEPWTGQREGT